MQRIGPYTVLDEVARGGHGVVYRARDDAGRVVALKLLLARALASPQAVRRFEGEVKALARLRHPHVVPIHAAGDHEGRPWLALEFVEGESLETRLRRGPLPIHEAIRVAQQLAQALSYVHSCGVLHRDLKPDNVLLRGADALLTDFGLVLDSEGSQSRLTASGIFQGTPGYWAPEQAQGEVAAHGPHTDVYGLGAVLYACLTGRPPVVGATLQDYLQTGRFRGTQAPRELRPETPGWLSALCMRCLAPDPGGRPPTAEVVARELLVAGAGGSAAEGQRSGVRGVVFAAVVLSLAVAGWLVTRSGAAAPPRTEPAVASEQVDGSALRQGHALAYCSLGVAWSSVQQFPRAVADFRLALELDPELAAAHAGVGIALSALGEHAAALAAFERATALDPRNATAHVGRGRVLVEQGRAQEALVDFARALELEPKSAFAAYLQGWTLGVQGKPQAALASLDRALELDPRLQRAVLCRGWAKADLGRYREALADFDRSLELLPGDPDSLLARGRVLRKLSRDEEAALAVEEAEARSPSDHVRLLGQLGVAWRELGQPRRALAAFERAIALNPEHAGLHHNRGLCLRDLQRGADALAAFERAIALDPELVEARVGRGRVLSDLGRYADSAEAYDRALELQGEQAQTLLERGASLMQAGSFADARRDFDRAVVLKPQEVAPLLKRGELLVQTGRQAEALEDYDRALELDPQSADTYAHRARALLELRRLSEALRDLDRAIELEPTGKRHRDRGVVHAYLGKWQRGVEDCDRALELGLEEAGVYVNRASCLLKLGGAGAHVEDYHQSVLRDLDRALELDPQVAEAYMVRARLWERRMQREEAVADLGRALALRPDAVKPLIQRGRLLTELGRADAARADLDRALELAPTVDSYLARGQFFFRQQRWEDALADYARAAAIDPRRGEIHSRRAAVLHAQGYLEPALEAYRRALDLGLNKGHAVSARNAIGRIERALRE